MSNTTAAANGSSTFPSLPTAAIVTRNAVRYNVQAVAIIINASVLLTTRLPMGYYSASRMCALTESDHRVMAAQWQSTGSNCYPVKEVILPKTAEVDLAMVVLDKPIDASRTPAQIPAKGADPKVDSFEFYNVDVRNYPYSSSYFAIHDFIPMKGSGTNQFNDKKRFSTKLSTNQSQSIVCPYYNGIPVMVDESGKKSVVGLQSYRLASCTNVPYAKKNCYLDMVDCYKMCERIKGGAAVQVEYVSLLSDQAREFFTTA